MSSWKAVYTQGRHGCIQGLEVRPHARILLQWATSLLTLALMTLAPVVLPTGLSLPLPFSLMLVVEAGLRRARPRLATFRDIMHSPH